MVRTVLHLSHDSIRLLGRFDPAREIDGGRRGSGDDESALSAQEGEQGIDSLREGNEGRGGGGGRVEVEGVVEVGMLGNRRRGQEGLDQGDGAADGDKVWKWSDLSRKTRQMEIGT